jgi:hypothetical protein
MYCTKPAEIHSWGERALFPELESHHDERSVDGFTAYYAPPQTRVSLDVREYVPGIQENSGCDRPDRCRVGEVGFRHAGQFLTGTDAIPHPGAAVAIGAQASNTSRSGFASRELTICVDPGHSEIMST